MIAARRIVAWVAAMGMVCGAGVAAEPATATKPAVESPRRIRVAAYNVMFGTHGTPEEIGTALRAHDLDVVGFSEAPEGDWTARVGKALGMNHAFVGRTFSANHKDKYKSILSRTPLRDAGEITLDGAGWRPASAVHAATTVRGCDVVVYSLHICGWSGTSPETDRLPSQSQSLADHLRTREKAACVIAMGDYNNHLGGPAMRVFEAADMRCAWPDLNVDLRQMRTGNALDAKDDWGVIDHVLYRPSSGMKAVGGGVIALDKPLSDHMPVWAELTLPATNP